MAELVAMFKPEFVFSLAFFIGFIGFGFFVNGSVWPWFQTYMNRAQDIDANRQARYDKILDVISELKNELGAFRETHSIILAYIIADLTDNKLEHDTDSAAARGMERRQTTQDLLLRKIQGDAK